MKINLTKGSQTRSCQPHELEMMTSAGWTPVTALKPKGAGEEIIRLKPPVKSKATETALEAASITKTGDE
jgi:hypothetical protein